MDRPTLLKSSGGPGSGKSRDSTAPIQRLDKSPLVTLHRRKKIMNHRSPEQTGKDLSLNQIDYGAQGTYDVEKLGWMLSNVEEWEEDPVQVVRIEGDHHLMDGHHRVLAADRLGMGSVKADVYVMGEDEVRRVTGQKEGSAKTYLADEAIGMGTGAGLGYGTDTFDVDSKGAQVAMGATLGAGAGASLGPQVRKLIGKTEPSGPTLRDVAPPGVGKEASLSENSEEKTAVDVYSQEISEEDPTQTNTIHHWTNRRPERARQNVQTMYDEFGSGTKVKYRLGSSRSGEKGVAKGTGRAADAIKPKVDPRRSAGPGTTGYLNAKVPISKHPDAKSLVAEKREDEKREDRKLMQELASLGGGTAGGIAGGMAGSSLTGGGRASILAGIGGGLAGSLLGGVAGNKATPDPSDVNVSESEVNVDDYVDEKTADADQEVGGLENTAKGIGAAYGASAVGGGIGNIAGLGLKGSMEQGARQRFRDSFDESTIGRSDFKNFRDHSGLGLDDIPDEKMPDRQKLMSQVVEDRPESLSFSDPDTEAINARQALPDFLPDGLKDGYEDMVATQMKNVGPAYSPAGEAMVNVEKGMGAGLGESPSVVAHEMGHHDIHKALGSAYAPTRTAAGLSTAAAPLGMIQYFRHRNKNPEKAKDYRDASMGMAGLGAGTTLADEAGASVLGDKKIRDAMDAQNLSRSDVDLSGMRKGLGKAMGTYGAGMLAPLAAAGGIYAADQQGLGPFDEGVGSGGGQEKTSSTAPVGQQKTAELSRQNIHITRDSAGDPVAQRKYTATNSEESAKKKFENSYGTSPDKVLTNKTNAGVSETAVRSDPLSSLPDSQQRQAISAHKADQYASRGLPIGLGIGALAGAGLTRSKMLAPAIGGMIGGAAGVEAGRSMAPAPPEVNPSSFIKKQSSNTPILARRKYYSHLNDKMVTVEGVGDNTVELSTDNASWTERPDAVREKIREGDWEKTDKKPVHSGTEADQDVKEAGMAKHAVPMAAIGGSVAGGAAGTGLNYAKQRGEIRSGRQERIDPYRLARSGAVGGAVGAAGPAAIRGGRELAGRARDLGQQAKRTMDEADQAFRDMQSAAEDLGNVRKNVDEGASRAEDFMDRMEDLADEVSETNQSFDDLAQKAKDNRFFGLFSKESSAASAQRKEASKKKIADAFVQFANKTDAPSPSKFENFLQDVDGVPNPTVRARPEKLNGPDMNGDNVVFAGNGDGPEMWEVATDEGRRLVPGIKSGGDELEVPDKMPGVADTTDANAVSEVSPVDLSRAESTGGTDTEFRVPLSDQARASQMSDAIIGAGLTGAAGYGGYSYVNRSGGQQPAQKRKYADQNGTITTAEDEPSLFEEGFDFDMPDPEMPEEMEMGSPDVQSTPDMQDIDPESMDHDQGDTDVDMTE